MNRKIISVYFGLITAIAIVTSIFFDAKISVVFICIGLLALRYSIYKEKLGQELVIAFLMALIITSYYVYIYSTSNIFIGRINIFPLLAWTAGLVILREIYEKMKSKHKYLFAVTLYWIVLFALEYIGYYIFEIRLDWNYNGLLGLGIIHGPNFMKFFYLFAGPIYLLLTDYLKVK
ncbi:MAG: hypothetical protein AABX35_03495 [Nanoarchaeota archaeon]